MSISPDQYAERAVNSGADEVIRGYLTAHVAPYLRQGWETWLAGFGADSPVVLADPTAYADMLEQRDSQLAVTADQALLQHIGLHDLDRLSPQ